jgi:hypothetical protein
MPGLRNRGALPPAVAQAFDALYATITPFLTVEQTDPDTATVAESVSLVIPDNTVSYAQMQNVSEASRVLGRGSANGAGDVEELTAGSGLTIASTTLQIASYAFGSWTPADGSGAALSFTSVEGSYVRLGPLVVAVGTVTYPATGDASAAVIGGLPVTSQATTRRLATGIVATDAAVALASQVNVNATTARLVTATTLATVANSALSGKVLSFSLVYTAG